MPIHLPINPKNCVFCSFHFCFWVLRISNWYSKDVALDKTIYSAMAYGISYVSMSLSFAHDQIIELILFCFFFFFIFRCRVFVLLRWLSESFSIVYNRSDKTIYQHHAAVARHVESSQYTISTTCSGYACSPIIQSNVHKLHRQIKRTKKIKNNNQSIWTFLVFAAHGRLKRITENTSKMVCLALWG